MQNKKSLNTRIYNDCLKQCYWLYEYCDHMCQLDVSIIDNRFLKSIIYTFYNHKK